MRRSSVLLLMAAAQFLPLPALGATSPPLFSISGGAILETSPTFTAYVQKSAKAPSYSKVEVSTVDGTAKAGVDYQPVKSLLTVGNNTTQVKVPVKIVARPGYQGNRSFTLHIKVTRYGIASVADAPVTILETERPTPLPPAPPPTQTCPDGSIIPATDSCPPPVPQWIAAPLRFGGYARITRTEGKVLTPDSANVPAPVGSIWYVIPGAWGHMPNMVDQGKTGRYVQALQPVDQIGVPFTAFYVYLDDIEGVAPAAPAPKGARMLAAKPQALKFDDSYVATAIRRCLSVGQTGDSRSSVEKGQQYRVSVREAGHANDHSPVVLVSAQSLASPVRGVALVPQSCLAPSPTH